MSKTPGAAILSIDVGTGSLKAAVSAPGGKLLSTANASVPYLPVVEDSPLTRAFDAGHALVRDSGYRTPRAA